MTSYEYLGDYYFIQVRLMKSTKNQPEPEKVEDFDSNEDNLGFIKDKYLEITDKLSKEIH